MTIIFNNTISNVKIYIQIDIYIVMTLFKLDIMIYMIILTSYR